MATQFVLFLHISSSWVKIRLYTENQLPMLSGSGLKVPGGWVVVGDPYPLSSQAPTHVEVEPNSTSTQLGSVKVIGWKPPAHKV